MPEITIKVCAPHKLALPCYYCNEKAKSESKENSPEWIEASALWHVCKHLTQSGDAIDYLMKALEKVREDQQRRTLEEARGKVETARPDIHGCQCAAVFKHDVLAILPAMREDGGSVEV